MKLLSILSLLLATLICHRAEKKSRGKGTYYPDRMLLRIEGAFIASAIWVALY